MKKYAIRFFQVLLVAVAIELICFQGMNLLHLMDKSYAANEVLTLENFATANWEQLADGTLRSRVDPILVIAGLNHQVDQVEIHMVTSKRIEYVEAFYINEKYPAYGEKILRGEVDDMGQTTLDVHDMVKDLRLDLGDEAGVILKELEVCLNPVFIRLSLSRITAIEIIYWSSVFLFSLQRSPNYHLRRQEEKNGYAP